MAPSPKQKAAIEKRREAQDHKGPDSEQHPLLTAERRNAPFRLPRPTVRVWERRLYLLLEIAVKSDHTP